jgi:hypothetical protein
MKILDSHGVNSPPLEELAAPISEELPPTDIPENEEENPVLEEHAPIPEEHPQTDIPQNGGNPSPPEELHALISRELPPTDIAGNEEENPVLEEHAPIPEEHPQTNIPENGGNSSLPEESLCAISQELPPATDAPDNQQRAPNSIPADEFRPPTVDESNSPSESRGFSSVNLQTSERPEVRDNVNEPSSSIVIPRPKDTSVDPPRSSRFRGSKLSLKSIILSGQKLRTLAGLAIPDVCESLDLSGNRLTNFRGLQALPRLTLLVLDDNPIKSFAEVVPLPRLRWLSLKRADICRSIYFRLMCVVAFGNQLTTLNDRQVTPQEKTQAEWLRETLLPELQAGSIIWKLNPLRLINLKENSTSNPNTELIEASIHPRVAQYLTPRVIDIVEGLKSGKTGERISIAQIVVHVIDGSLRIGKVTRQRFLEGIAGLRSRTAPIIDVEPPAEESKPSMTRPTELGQERKGEEEEEKEEEEREREKRQSGHLKFEAGTQADGDPTSFTGTG